MEAGNERPGALETKRSDVLTMQSKQPPAKARKISPILFLTADGKPMCFYVRPGAAKCFLNPYIKAGGGMVSNVQNPDSILLIEPEESFSIPENNFHRYVSAQYVRDCIDQNVQLDLESYRLQSEEDKKTEVLATSSGGGRMPFTPEEDAAILSYIAKHNVVDQLKGNRLWQEMEKAGVTSHSWQSMKARFKKYLFEKERAAEPETKVETNQETAIQNPSCDKDAAPPQVDSSATDPTQVSPQIDAQPAEAESTQPEMEEMQATITTPQAAPEEASAAPEEASAAPEEASAAPEEASAAPEEASAAPEEASAAPEEASAAPEEASAAPEEASAAPEEASAAPEEASAAPEEASAAPEEASAAPEEASAAQDESVPDTPTPKKHKAPEPVQPQRRSARRQLELEEPELPRPHVKKLRSASMSHSPQPLKSSPRLAKKLAVKLASENIPTTEQPPPKRARGRRRAAATESSQESGQDTPTKKSQADEESRSVPQKGRRTKRKTKLGILELATKEFESESESQENETTEPQDPAETGTKAPLTESQVPASDTAAEDAPPQSHPEGGPVPQENGAEAQASTINHLPETSCPEPAAAEPLPSTSKAHLFIFDSESQEEEPQSVLGDDTAAPSIPQPPLTKDVEPSLTQVQLEEDKQRIRQLMSQTNQDLVCVTKALIKTSGDFAAALRLLSNASGLPGPYWNRHDDSLLRSGDPAARQQLQEKYGEEDTAKRIVYLEAEG